MSPRAAAAIRLAGVLALLLAAACERTSGGAAPGDAQRPPNVLLVTVDTLRADHLGFAGYPRDTSPNLDRLAGEGTWFRRVYSASATTGASHASLFTSQAPPAHGVTANNQRIAPPDELPTLMSALAGRGYATAAFVSSVVVGRKSGLQRHFEHFDDELTTKELNRKARYERPAGHTIDAVLRWLDAQPADRPFFLWIHLIDPHGPYAAPDDPNRYVGDAHARRLDLELPAGDSDWSENAIPRYQVLGGRRDASYYVARYDAEIRYADRELGRLLDDLRRSGLYDRTLIAVTADHGETLAEPGHKRFFAHGTTTYEEVVRVPLVVREPAGAKRLESVDVERPVSTLDVAPTLLALLGVTPPPTFRGRNLLVDPLPDDAPMFSLGSYGTKKLEKEVGTQFGVRRGPLRYLVNSKDGSEELYDHRDDPRETQNRIADAAHAAPVADLRSGVAALVGERSRIAAPAPLTAEQEAALRALGYVE